MSNLQLIRRDENDFRHTRPCGHAVQFYENDAALVDTLGQHFAPALAAGDTAILVATPEHTRSLARELTVRGINLEEARASHQYLELDAATALNRIMLHGWPDAGRFHDAVGRVIARAEGLSQGRRVVIYGEMVTLLWQQGRHEATLRLEQLWNEFAARHSFFLLCGYPLDLFSRADHRQMFFNICGEHTDVNPENGNGKLRYKGLISQPPQALDEEIRASQERILLLEGASHAGTWELDITNDVFTLSASAAKLLGLPSARVPRARLLDQMYYSGDRDAVLDGLDQAQKGRRNFVATFRVLNGEATRLLEIRGKTYQSAGAPIMLGVLLDITPVADA